MGKRDRAIITQHIGVPGPEETRCEQGWGCCGLPGRRSGGGLAVERWGVAGEWVGGGGTEGRSLSPDECGAGACGLCPERPCVAGGHVARRGLGRGAVLAVEDAGIASGCGGETERQQNQ